MLNNTDTFLFLVLQSILTINSARSSPICVVQIKSAVVNSIGDAIEEGQNQRENMERAAVQQIVHSLMVDHGIFVVASKYNLHHLYIQSKKKNKQTKSNGTGPSDPSNTIRLAVSNLHTEEQIEHAVQCLLQVSESVCRDLYGSIAVDASQSTAAAAKKKKATPAKKKKSTRAKSTGRKKK